MSAELRQFVPQAVAQLQLVENTGLMREPQVETLLFEIAQRPVAQISWAFIGVSDYELTRALPNNLKSSLPSIEEIEAELSGEAGG
jgi:hypothetical protein